MLRPFLLLVSVLFALQGFSQQQEDFSNNSIKKGNVLISATFAINHSEGENQSILIQNFDETYRLKWDLTLRSGYFIKDNFAVGAFLKYSNDIDELVYTIDNNQVADNRLEREYSVAPFIRNYLPLGKGRFCLFNETNLQFTYGNSVRQVEDISDVNRTVGESYQLKLGIQPGVAAFINDGIAIEVGTSLLGLSTAYTTAVINGNEDDKSYSFSNEVNFKIDLLSLFLGVTFYFQ